MKQNTKDVAEALFDFLEIYNDIIIPEMDKFEASWEKLYGDSEESGTKLLHQNIGITKRTMEIITSKLATELSAKIENETQDEGDTDDIISKALE